MLTLCQQESKLNVVLTMIKDLYLICLTSSLISHPMNMLTKNMCSNEVNKQDVVRITKPKLNKNYQMLKELLVCSSMKRGEKYFNACSGCHPINERSSHRFGPNLWNVVFRSIACCSGYTYSLALIRLSNLKWTLNNLNKFIRQPSSFANGTYMTFSGIKNPIERMDILNYLNYNSYRPLSFNKFRFN
ncbi:Cytochrome c [Candidatus Hodgkinia cicadicola]|uniref:Cytochrome c n=1 Tax=Candidatus Hodgkinia cicadicola TaxID=573658 RepID=A0ABX4MHC9_9HYPH|nr:Cytochrome c [Candidatus Hodgkinia cicadicola]